MTRSFKQETVCTIRFSRHKRSITSKRGNLPTCAKNPAPVLFRYRRIHVFFTAPLLTFVSGMV